MAVLLIVGSSHGLMGRSRPEFAAAVQGLSEPLVRTPRNQNATSFKILVDSSIAPTHFSKVYNTHKFTYLLATLGGQFGLL